MMRSFRTKARARKVSQSFPTCLNKRCFGIPRARVLYHSEHRNGFSKNPVNAYALYGMELASTTKASTSTGSSSLASQAHGMLDCGATASAAPEVSAQELVKAVLSHDRQATVNISLSAAAILSLRQWEVGQS